MKSKNEKRRKNLRMNVTHNFFTQRPRNQEILSRSWCECFKKLFDGVLSFQSVCAENVSTCLVESQKIRLTCMRFRVTRLINHPSHLGWRRNRTSFAELEPLTWRRRHGFNFSRKKRTRWPPRMTIHLRSKSIPTGGKEAIKDVEPKSLDFQDIVRRWGGRKGTRQT